MKSLLLFLPLLLVACSQTPETRIAHNPAIFSSLTANQKDLVQAGRIAKGMPKGGVFLAWGHPDQALRGQKNDRSFEQWDYTALRPVYTTGLSFGYGTGFGAWGGPYGSFGLGPDISYIPYPTGSVLFEDKRVTEWKQIQ